MYLLFRFIQVLITVLVFYLQSRCRRRPRPQRVEDTVELEKKWRHAETWHWVLGPVKEEDEENSEASTQELWSRKEGAISNLWSVPQSEGIFYIYIIYRPHCLEEWQCCRAHDSGRQLERNSAQTKGGGGGGGGGDSSMAMLCNEPRDEVNFLLMRYHKQKSKF